MHMRLHRAAKRYPSALATLTRLSAQVGPLYLAAMDAMHEVSPDTTYLVEGCGQLGFPGMNWGDGFVTDGALIQQYGLSDPRGIFFDPLRSKPYLNNVGISPHVYPPSVTFQGTVRPSPLPPPRPGACACLPSMRASADEVAAAPAPLGLTLRRLWLVADLGIWWEHACPGMARGPWSGVCAGTSKPHWTGEALQQPAGSHAVPDPHAQTL